MTTSPGKETDAPSAWQNNDEVIAFLGGLDLASVSAANNEEKAAMVLQHPHQRGMPFASTQVFSLLSSSQQAAVHLSTPEARDELIVDMFAKSSHLEGWFAATIRGPAERLQNNFPFWEIFDIENSIVTAFLPHAEKDLIAAEPSELKKRTLAKKLLREFAHGEESEQALC